MHFTEEQISMILGALIAGVPTIAAGLFSFGRWRLQCFHERKMLQIELVTKPRIEALTNYARFFGPMLSLGAIHPSGQEDFVSAHQLALLYVSDDTLAAMNAAFPVILAGWEDGYPDVAYAEKPLRPEVARLIACLRRELRSAGRLDGTLPMPNRIKQKP